jgi:outer membrane biosynthesis protein TonB
MRKTGIFVLTAVLAVSLLGGCSQKADEQIGELPSPPSSFSAGKALKPPAQGDRETDAQKAEATARPEETASPDAPGQSGTATAEVQNGQGGNRTDAGAATPPPAQPKPKPSPKPKSETPQPTPQPKDETPSSAPQPEQAAPEPPKPRSAYDAPYDTAAIIADASAYGAGIGMTWSGSLNTGNCSWEAPGTTSADLSGERLKAAIQGRIARIKKLQQDNGYQPGEFHFKVLFESQGNGEYTIYFLMG